MVPALKDLPAGQAFEKDGLADVLRVLSRVQIGVRKPQDQIGIGVYQPFGLLLVHLSHGPHLLSKPARRLCQQRRFTYNTNEGRET